MESCKFIKELNRLRKSSSDSIDNVEVFTDFKKYMHVSRTAEEDLREILKKVNCSRRKTLVLLCGSAGDGKSHLLSYLRNFDEAKLLDEYVVYNDATESNSPSKTAIETLNELLSSFNDENINASGKNIILAINLGVLSNFIESEFGDSYSLLRTYVEKSNILTTQINLNEYDANSPFQHVSFSDYHMYSITKDGICAKYILDIMKKVFDQDENNMFYESYTSECATCPLSQKCPVKRNYEFLMDTECQKFIAGLLVKTTIQDKTILTTREILNFVYDIVVSQNFSYTKFQKLLVSDSAYIKEFLKQITPALLFDSRDASALMNMMQKYDPLLTRTENADENAISYYVSSDVTNEVALSFENNAYGSVICDPITIKKVNNDKAIKAQLYNLMIRVNAISVGLDTDVIYKKYLQDLFWFNSGQEKKLGTLYSMVEKSVTQWCGSDSDGNLCLDERNQAFTIFEKIEFEECLEYLPVPTKDVELNRFVPSITVSFFDKSQAVISLDVDYSLYELIYKLNYGYIQTADDRNNHADFISFVSKLLQTGSLEKKVTVKASNGMKAYVSKGKFGYKFKVVK